MIRQIIKIDENKCNGCGACATACHEGAIKMLNGKAKLIRDDYCDGLGDCLPSCPTGAITFEMREALAYNEQAVLNAKAEACSHKDSQGDTLPCGCPSNHAKSFNRNIDANGQTAHVQDQPSQLQQWPVQIKLVPTNAPYFNNANLLISADCTAYAYGNFHNKFMRNKITIVGCPKLDMVDYSEKLTEIIKNNDIKSVTVVRMEVPCCGGIENAVKHAIQASGKFLPWQVVTISTDGRILD